MKFTCHVSGEEIEWGNTSSTSNMIRLDDNFPIGRPYTRGAVTVTFTSQSDSTGIVSDYTVNVTHGAEFGLTRIYCRDSDDGGKTIHCPPTAIIPGNIQTEYQCTIL